MKDSFNIFTSKFFYLLISIITYLIALAFLDGVNERNFVIGLLFSLLILLCVFAITNNRILVAFSIILGSIGLTCHWIINTTHTGYYLYLVYYFNNIILLTIITFYILSGIAHHKEISANTLFGAICGYFFVGLTWSFIYILIQTFDAGAFSKYLLTSSVHESAENFFYYSFTTLTTLGYGDILPVSNLARTFSWLEAMVGQIYLAVWISQLVGLKIAQRLSKS